MKNRTIVPYILLKHKYSAIDMHSSPGQHSHIFYQMVCVFSGTGMIHTTTDIIPLSPGNIVLIPPSVKHVIVTDNEPMVTSELKFDIFDDVFVDLFTKDKIFFCDRHKEIFSLFQKIIHEAQENSFLAEDYVTYLFSQILVLFARFFYSDKQTSDQKKTVSFSQVSDDRLAQSIKMYIEENSKQNLRTEDIAASFFLSPSSVYRKFMKAYNVSPMQYLNHVRIQKAKQLLESSDYSITEISNMVGFSSIHYFSKSFSASENVSPATYRSNKKSNYSLTYRKPENDFY